MRKGRRWRKLHASREYFSDKIVDKVGSGDCFMAGLIRGLYHGAIRCRDTGVCDGGGLSKIIYSKRCDRSARGRDSKIYDIMSDKKLIVQSILGQGVLPLFYYDSPSVSLKVVQTLYKAGVRAVEYTNRGAAALDNFSDDEEDAGGGSAGSLPGYRHCEDAGGSHGVRQSGADFIIAPIVNPAVAAVAAEAGLLWMPGCMTPTEIFLAQQHKAEIIKLFPANMLGPEFVHRSGSFPRSVVHPYRWSRDR
jgi:2-keto-3-deoxy-6-phosphogluconate aldolase